MKKAIIVLLIAAVAMTAVFANTSDKNGFAIKADAIGCFGAYGAAYRLGNFEFGAGYFTQTMPLTLVDIIAEGDLTELIYCVYPFGGIATIQYKFLATEQHEVGAYVELGFTTFVGPLAAVGVEYDYCFNQNHAVYAKAAFPCYPFYPELALYLVDIGYRYTF